MQLKSFTISSLLLVVLPLLTGVAVAVTTPTKSVLASAAKPATSVKLTESTDVTFDAIIPNGSSPDAEPYHDKTYNFSYYKSDDTQTKISIGWISESSTGELSASHYQPMAAPIDAVYILVDVSDGTHAEPATLQTSTTSIVGSYGTTNPVKPSNNHITVTFDPTSTTQHDSWQKF